MKLYLAGPMTGYPQFNFPLFHKAAKELREQGFSIISPAEEDEKHGIAATAMASKDGKLDASGKIEGQTWGDILARDVKIVADLVDGIVFLPQWEKSKGARLEAFVAILAGKQLFFTYSETGKTASIGPYSVKSLLVGALR